MGAVSVPAGWAAIPQMNRLHPWYWTLWAQRRRKALAQNGYPRQVPWYTPPLLGDVYSDRERTHISDRDIEIVESIEMAISHIRQRMPEAVRHLEVWEGAYVDAPLGRAARIREFGLSYEACKKGSKRAKEAAETIIAACP